MSSVPSPTRHPALTLTALALAQLIIGLDYNIVFVALPDIGVQVGFTGQTLQWVISAYAIAFGGFLMLGGRAADLFGKRKMFMVGLLCYGVASLIGGYAEQPIVLVSSRALQGLGGALLTPATLSLVTSLFAEGASRNRAIGIWGAAGSSGMVLGSILGGVLTQSLGWESVFFVNVPLTLAVIALSIYAIPQDPERDKGRNFDLIGALTVTFGSSLLVYSLVIGPETGWLNSRTLICLLGSVFLLIAFTVIELRSSDPLIPMYLLKNSNLSTGAIITFCFMASFGALAYFLTIYLQQVRRLDAFTTGMAFVLPCAFILLGTIVGGKLSTVLGLKSALLLGLVMGAIGTSIFAILLTPTVSWWVLAPCVAVFSLAQGMVFTAMFATATSGVAVDKQGIASGIAASGQQIGAAVGLAALVALSKAYNANGLNDNISIINVGLRTAFFSATVIMSITLVIAFKLKSPVSVMVTDPNHS